MANRSQLSSLISFLERWQRSHSGGFVRSARGVAVARQRMETVRLFALKNPDSALADPSMIDRIAESTALAAFQNCQILKCVLKDFENALKFAVDLSASWPENDGMSCFIKALVFAATEELKLRRTIALQLSKPDSVQILQSLLVLTSELDEYIPARALSVCPLQGCLLNFDSLRKLIRSKIS